MNLVQASLEERTIDYPSSSMRVLFERLYYGFSILSLVKSTKMLVYNGEHLTTLTTGPLIQNGNVFCYKLAFPNDETALEKKLSDPLIERIDINLQKEGYKLSILRHPKEISRWKDNTRALVTQVDHENRLKKRRTFSIYHLRDMERYIRSLGV